MRIDQRYIYLLFGLGILPVVGCANNHPSDELVFQCDPANDTCGAGSNCVLAGTKYVCSQNSRCLGGCVAPEVCVDGTCQCFKDCDGRLCGDDGCGGSCGSCPSGDSWWCDAGVCKDDCVDLECGDSPNLTINCGTCDEGWWCDSGTCKDDCAELECGESPNLGVNCGLCQERFWCDAGTCVDDCGTTECGTSEHGLSCGDCSEGWWCDSGTCKADCDGLNCGPSPVLEFNCGTCEAGWWCDSGTCRDDCIGLECGTSPMLGISCGTCPRRTWCNAGTCEDDCGTAECGTSSHGANCGYCLPGSNWWCDDGTCKDDCTALECGKSPLLNVTCGTCPDKEWCNAGTCEDDCGSSECGSSPHGLSCGTCPAKNWCYQGSCLYDCGTMTCGTSIHGISCGSCPAKNWCNAGSCEDDCGTRNCGTSTHGISCGSCHYGWWCDAGTCKDDCLDMECGDSPILGISCGSCPDMYICDEGTCKQDCRFQECGFSEYGNYCGSCKWGSSLCMNNSWCKLWAPDTYTVKCGTNNMCHVPGGTFSMGCDEGSFQNCPDDTMPLHQVTLTGFYVDRTEVTQGAYKKCVDAGKCAVPSCNWNPATAPNKPVACVTSAQADAYCLWVGKRLPTEAEWEMAARGTDRRLYPWGMKEPACDLVTLNSYGSSCGQTGTMDVCSKSPAGDSPYGLCDMSGNVAEFVADWWSRDYYSTSPALDPTGPLSGSWRAIRGGSYCCGDSPVSSLCWPPHLYAYWRMNQYISGQWDWLGFRCAKDAG